MANQVALIGAIKLLVDGGKDVLKSLEPNQTVADRIMDFENLIPDALAELQVVGDIKAEIQSLQPADFASLGGVLIADLGLSDPAAQAIAQASLKVLEDAASDVIPDVKALIEAIQMHAGPVLIPPSPVPAGK